MCSILLYISTKGLTSEYYSRPFFGETDSVTNGYQNIEYQP